MSFDFNYKFWQATKKDIKQLIKKQSILQTTEPIEDPKITFDILSQIYILYAELVQKLGYLYVETFQVQKKLVIRNLLEPAIQRLLDLKKELKQIGASDYVYMNKTLIDRKLTPYDLFIWRRSSFRYNRPPEIKAVFVESHRYIKTSSEDIADAICKIQSHERARKARLLKSALQYSRINLAKNTGGKVTYSFSHKSDVIHLIPVKRTLFHSDFIKSSSTCQKALGTERRKETEVCDASDLAKRLENAALIIQTAWKNYRAKNLLKMRRNIKQIMYGMRKPRKLLNIEEYEHGIRETHRKYSKQLQLNKYYDQLKSEEHSRLLQKYKSVIMEDISDHIREWFKEFYEKTGDFHPYPDANNSGTVSLLTDETMTLEEFKVYQDQQKLSKEEIKNAKEKLKLEQQKEKQKAHKEKLKEIKEEIKKRNAGIYDIGNELQKDENVEKFKKTFSQYSTDWKNVDEYLLKNDIIKEWVTETELAAVHKELRILVDKYMRLEYNLLKKALSADKKIKFKPSITKEKKKLNKTGKKKARDLSAGRTVESLYHELRAAEVIDIYTETAFGDYIGEFNITADKFRNESKLVTLNPSKADIKLVIQDILFGMGEFDVKKQKSLCLIGPVNNGKRMLCNIIASELGALIINLSPEKTFPFSKNLKYFIQIVVKVAKAFQPTIIVIHEAHRIFWKKIPKDQVHVQPTLLKKSLAKDILKSIGKNDKIIVVGTSSSPWSASAKFKRVFQNFLLIPASDYGTMFLTWLQLLTQNVNNDYFDDSILSVLAKVFAKYNTGDITDNVKSILNVDRRLRLHSNPLNPMEFLDHFLFQTHPLFPEDEKVSEKFKEFYNKSSKYGKLLKQSKKTKVK